MSVSVFNRCWARVIVQSLMHQGVKHFCIAPGSRSTPLTLEAAKLANEQKATCHTHFDERGLGFFALGLAKVSQAPVAIIVTSGTAAANLYPAIIEARQSAVNLIVLTADRPPELLECGANQAILQQNMFADYPIVNVNLPRPSADYSAAWLLSTLDHACQQQRKQPGVVHINVPFAEPLYNADEDGINQHRWLTTAYGWQNRHQTWISEGEILSEVVTHEHWEHWRTQKGVVVVGRLPAEQAMGIQAWANALGWILITDIQSNVAPILPHADVWLANSGVRQKLLKADIVIQFGSRFISKRINQFLSDFDAEYWIVDENTMRVDPTHHRHTRFYAKAHHWLRAHPACHQPTWLLEPQALSNFCSSFISEQLNNNFNEASLAHHIAPLVENKALFLGNSLIARLADALTILKEGTTVYSNRGASGIDGLLATAAGIAHTAKQPLVALIGDMSALYDINSLTLFKGLSQPALIFVLNNNGGAIFDLLPVDNEVKNEFYRLPHNSDFAAACAMFKIKYARPYTWGDLNTIVKNAYFRRETTLIEIKVNPSNGSHFYQNLIEQIGQAVVG